jgi:hypothetical protein
MGTATDQELLARSLRNPGRLVLGPTTLLGGFPYGGVSLGFHHDAEIIWHSEYVRVRDPASGRLSEVGRRGAEWPEIYCVVDGYAWDTDALIAVFSRTISPVGTNVPQPPETVIQGTTIPFTMSVWAPMLFAPTDPRQKAVYFTRPIPTLSLRTSTALAMNRRAGLPLMFSPTADSNWATRGDYQIGRLENLTL